MKLPNFFKKRERPIDFSESHLASLTTLTDELGDTLIKTGFGNYVDHLSQIRLSAQRHENETFKKQVISRTLFGGAGALWEIWIEDKQLRTKFNVQFSNFVDLLKKMGIENERINQIRQSLPHSNED